MVGVRKRMTLFSAFASEPLIRRSLPTAARERPQDQCLAIPDYRGRRDAQPRSGVFPTGIRVVYASRIE